MSAICENHPLLARRADNFLVVHVDVGLHVLLLELAQTMHRDEPSKLFLGLNPEVILTTVNSKILIEIQKYLS